MIKFQEVSAEEFDEMTPKQKSRHIEQREEHRKSELEAVVTERVKGIESAFAEKLQEVKDGSAAKVKAAEEEFSERLREMGASVDAIKEAKSERKEHINKVLSNAKKAYDEAFENQRVKTETGTGEDGQPTFELGGLDITQENRKSFNFTFRKSEPNSVKADTTTGSLLSNTEGLRLDEISKTPINKFPTSEIFGQPITLAKGQGRNVYYRQYNSAVIAYLAAAIAEGAAFPTDTFGMEEKFDTLKKIGVTNVVTEEILNGFDYVMNELQAFMWDDHHLEVFNQVINGSGVGANLRGIVTIGALNPFALLGDFSGTIQAANIVDLINVTGSKVFENAEYNDQYFNPKIAIMHPQDVQKYFAAKDANNNPLYPELATAKVKQIGNITVFETPKITAGTMLVGDSSVSKIFTTGLVNVTIGYQGSQFGEDKLTLKIREEMLLQTKNIYENAYTLVLDIDLALADITI